METTATPKQNDVRDYYCLPVAGAGATIYDNRTGKEIATTPDLETGDAIVTALGLFDIFAGEFEMDTAEIRKAARQLGKQRRGE
jgi:hypothetical protein